ncbi:MAG: flippase [Candidatus Marinimicrobia bacterium]|nr:flippase [Candidatus Neomarinimicrobiota bacterium]
MSKQFVDEIKIAREATITMGGSLASGLLRYLFNILIARLLGVELLGLYALGSNVTRLGATVGKMGLDTGIFRFIARYRSLDLNDNIVATIRRGVKVALGSALLMTAAVFLSATWISDQIFNAGDTILANLLRGFALAIPLMIEAQVLSAVSQGFKVLKYKVLALQVIPGFAISLIFVMLVFWAKPFLTLTIAFTGAHIISLIAAVYYLIRLVPLTHGSGGEFPPDLVQYSLPLMMSTMLSMLLYMSDVFMLGALAGSYATGLYQPALRTATVLNMIIASFGGIFAPMVSDLHAKNNIGKVQELLCVVSRWSLAIVWPSTLFLIVYASQVMLLFGDEFLASTSSLSILAGSQILIVITTGNGIIFGMTGHPRLNLINNFAALVTNIIANAYLIPLHGLVGAAWGTLIAIVLLAVLRLVEAWVLFRLHPFSISLIKPLIAGLVASAACALINLTSFNWPPISVLLAGMTIFSVIYLFVYYLLGVDQTDREVIQVIYHKLRRANG